MEKAAAVYGNIRSRRDTKAWEKLFADDCFLSLEEEENCRIKLLRFIMDHFRLPGEVWKLLDKKLDITAGAASLREKFPADFIRYLLNGFSVAWLSVAVYRHDGSGLRSYCRLDLVGINTAV